MSLGDVAAREHTHIDLERIVQVVPKRPSFFECCRGGFADISSWSLKGLHTLTFGFDEKFGKFLVVRADHWSMDTLNSSSHKGDIFGSILVRGELTYHAWSPSGTYATILQYFDPRGDSTPLTPSSAPLYTILQASATMNLFCRTFNTSIFPR